MQLRSKGTVKEEEAKGLKLQKRKRNKKKQDKYTDTESEKENHDNAIQTLFHCSKCSIEKHNNNHNTNSFTQHVNKSEYRNQHNKHDKNDGIARTEHGQNKRINMGIDQNTSSGISENKARQSYEIVTREEGKRIESIKLILNYYQEHRQFSEITGKYRRRHLRQFEIICEEYNTYTSTILTHFVILSNLEVMPTISTTNSQKPTKTGKN